MDYKAFPPELKANLSGNHGRNRKCSFSQIRNLFRTNTARISGLPKKWQTGGREKCLSAAEPIKFLKVWLIRLPRFCVDDSNSVPNLPLPMKNIGKKTPGSSIHKLYDLRSPNSQPSELGNLTRIFQTLDVFLNVLFHMTKHICSVATIVTGIPTNLLFNHHLNSCHRIRLNN